MAGLHHDGLVDDPAQPDDDASRVQDYPNDSLGLHALACPSCACYRGIRAAAGSRPRVVLYLPVSSVTTPMISPPIAASARSTAIAFDTGDHD